jgi:hypothetical protein
MIWDGSSIEDLGKNNNLGFVVLALGTSSRIVGLPSLGPRPREAEDENGDEQEDGRRFFPFCCH